MQMAKHLGLRVLATAGTEEGLGIVRDCGADFTYNHRQPGYMEKIMVSHSSAILSFRI